MSNVVPFRTMAGQRDKLNDIQVEAEPAEIVRASIADTRQLLEREEVSPETACQGLEQVRAHLASIGAPPDVLAELQTVILEIGDVSGRG